MSWRIDRLQYHSIRNLQGIAIVKSLMRIGRPYQFADINSGIMIPMDFQMGTHKIGMGMGLHDGYNFRSLLLCIGIIRPRIASRIHKDNFPVG